MKKRFSILLFLLSGAAHAQVRLTLEDAIEYTLKNNFDIAIANLSNRQAHRNNTIGNAGFLPNVALTANHTRSLTNVKSDLANGSTQNNPRATSVNYNPLISVNWTIFDGGRMFVVKKQLNELEALSKDQLRIQVQSMVSRTIQMYAQIVWNKKRLIAIDTGLALAKTRMELANLKYQTGAGAKIDYLQARVDYNSRRADSFNFVATITQANDSLSVLMGVNEDQQYIVDDSLTLNVNLQPVDKQRLEEANLTLNAFRRNVTISHLNADIAKTAFLPTLTLNGGVSYTQSANSVGFALSTRNYGPTGTLSLGVPLFYGGNIRREAKIASLQVMKDELAYEKQNTVIGRQYRTAWVVYIMAVADYRLERESIVIAKENLDVQQARFRLGFGTTLETRVAENDYVAALQRIYTADYYLKVSETIVLELQNQLVIAQ
jgi:outer membrane protein